MTRTIFLILTLTIAFNKLVGQNLSTNRNDISDSGQIFRIAGTCKVWGLVKYYNKSVARKKIDWDEAFINNYENLNTAKDFETYNIQLKILLTKAKVTSRQFTKNDTLKAKWILNGELSKLDNFSIINDTLNFIRQPDFSWIKNDEIFSNEIQNLLIQIIIDYKPVSNRYLKGNVVISHNENPFSKIDSVSESYRLLGLFRYWNIVNYFFPYKHLTNKSWDSVLLENIPRFQKYGTYYEYLKQIEHLATEINDSHAWGTYVDSKKGLKQKPLNYYQKRVYYFPPFNIEIIENKVVVSKVLNDTLTLSGRLQKGDIILKVNNRDVNKIIHSFRSYNPYSSSSEQSFHSSARQSLITYFADTSLFSFNIIRGNDSLLVNNIVGLPYKSIRNTTEVKGPAYYSIEESIGYINLNKAGKKDLRKAYHKYKNLSTIIFDMRGYPSGIAPIFLPRMFSRKPIPVANYFYPSKKYAGVFIKNKIPENYFVENTVTLLIKYLFNTTSKIAPTFNSIYKGKVIVLVNDEAVSYAETVCMILKAYPKNVTFIGTPTQGANGDVISFFMPGGIKTGFSSLDWHFPDGKQLQRIGIIPDIEVKTTIESIKKSNDEILERAILYAQTGK